MPLRRHRQQITDVIMTCSRCCRHFVAGWDAIQVELHGQYSLERLKRFHEYVLGTSALRVVLVIIVTPVPCILAIVLADSIPLEPPQRGIDHSEGFWVRSVFATFVYSHAIVSQVRNYVPRLSLSRYEQFAISVPVAFLTCIATYGLARWIGFPVPFTIPLTSLPWTWLMVFFMGLTRGRFLLQNRDVLSDLLQYSLVMMCQMSMIILYPLLYSAFSKFSSSSQTLFAFVLPVIKLIEKNLICRVLGARDDIKPELVIFNVEIFNSLFVSCCMQSAGSINTNLVIMVVDLLQAYMGVRDLNKMLAEFNYLAEKMHMEKGQLIETVMTVLKDFPILLQHRNLRSTTLAARSQTLSQIVPQASFHRDHKHRVAWFATDAETRLASKRSKPSSWLKNSQQQTQITSQQLQQFQISGLPTATADTRQSRTIFSRAKMSIGDALSADERLLFVQKALQMLFLTEFLLLIEFTEVVIPLIYCKCYCFRL